MKNFSTEIYEEVLVELTFSDYEKFDYVNEAYSADLISKIFDVVNKVTPTKTIIRVKNNTNEWFDGMIADKIAARDKLFRKFKKSKLSVDEILNKEARNIVQALIKDKKENFCEKGYPKLYESQKGFGKL